MNRPSRIDICETCGGEGTVIEFRRFAGEYIAGEPVEVECGDCGGTGEFEAVCDFCAASLDADGGCASCEEPLTEVQGDPMLKAKRRAA